MLPNTQEIRAWAEQEGHLKKGSRGRVPGHVVEKWEAR
jgi:hypothetical protein